MQRRPAVLAALAAALALVGSLAPAPDAAARWSVLLEPALAPPTSVHTPAEWQALRAGDAPPLPGIQDGLGPGSAMHQSSPEGGFICTAAFLLRDPYTGTYYLSTAGHCLVRDETDTTPYTGAGNPDKVDDLVEVCVAQCIDNALGVGEYVEIRPRDGVHPIVFAQSGGVGADFGIVQLPPELHGDLRPHMPMWGGPTGAAAPSAGDLLVHFGHGSYCCEVVGAVASRTPVDQGRAAVAIGSDGESFSGVGHITGGDSGSGIELGTQNGDVVAGAEAVGVITHGLVGAGSEFSGTLLSEGLRMVQAHTGLRLELVLAGDPLPVEPTATPPVEAPSNLTVTSPAQGATIGLDAKVVRVAGFAERAGGPLANGTQVQVAVDDAAFGVASRVPIAGNSTWRGDWDLAGAKVGDHTLRARLVAANGAVLDSENVTVHLQKGPTPASSSASGTKAKPPAGATGASRPATGNATDGGDKPKGAPLGLLPALAGVALAAVVAASRRRH